MTTTNKQGGDTVRGYKYEVLKEIRGFTLASIRAEINGAPADGVWGRDKFYMHHETIPEGEELELFGNIDLTAMTTLRHEGHVRLIGRFDVPEDRVEMARTRHPF